MARRSTPKPPPFRRPAYASPPRFDTSRGPAVVDFARTHLTVSKGPRVGQPLEYLAWQRWLLGEVLEERPSGLLRYRRGLVGVGRQNGKSLIGSGLALSYLYGAAPGAEVYSVAGDRQQARIVFGEARRQVLNNPALEAHANVFKDAIEITQTGSVYRVLSSESRLAQGFSPSLVIFDEVHVQKNRDLWEALTEGTGARHESLILGITTAGADLDSLAGGLYEYGVEVATGATVDDAFGFWWWSAPDGCDLDDLEGWKDANPSLAEDLTSLEDIEMASRTTAPNAFRRYRLNQWVRWGGTGWMDMVAWDAAATDLPLEPDTPVVAHFDGSVDRDATVIVVVTVTDPPRAYLWGIWEDRTGGRDESWRVDRGEVDEALTALMDGEVRGLNVRALSVDPSYWRSEADEWQTRWGDGEHGGRVWILPTTNARMGPAVAETYKRIKTRELLHGEANTDWAPAGGVDFRRHVSNAVEKPLANGLVTLRKERRASRRHIDAAVALVSAVDTLESFGKPKPPDEFYTFR